MQHIFASLENIPQHKQNEHISSTFYNRKSYACVLMQKTFKYNVKQYILWMYDSLKMNKILKSKFEKAK